ncbi:MAG: tRNA preQ1(34) S-adenosylmethionine ribosyltransferase-isomerase QueA [Jaaginema sp. PMC 1079.18]|nr:tRNA preQ1(34) S-adenosylmethionine ribosyltransferase-isomerase QueA [Jaaginema sp. PMC 1080.18]MEC4850252.1 tRNA preQ1(34) S-adenosylmethionine ribosyltransferase-isomerase QueA [Jaaginema sp. PMC 1079.18]MEC4867191.1 tRNA preQ1(34) S-adenosylmethionine ribosyltransferase-isomerase QueA [Jaaginema sp. PMC 1078.18]
MTDDCLLSNYHYHLPEDYIAQNPVTPRDSSRLLVVDSPTSHTYQHFRDLPQWLEPGDLLIFNNTQVIAARLYGRKTTGAKVEILLLEEKSRDCWLALVKPGKRFTVGSTITFEPHSQDKCPSDLWLKAQVCDRDDATGGRILQFSYPPGQSFMAILDYFGQVPLPPYVTASESLPTQYQTVYAQQPGAVAAPTAGLHFTPDLLQILSEKGIQQAYLTLHVGVGTFRPVEVENITTHEMHSEWFCIDEEVVRKIEATKAAGHRTIAVGTTAVRALEGAAALKKEKLGHFPQYRYLAPLQGRTNLFIYPGYQWQVVDGMITNFHLPGSSLLMLVSALIGRNRLLSLYQDAIAQKMRFYSFGDAMLILPQGTLASKNFAMSNENCQSKIQ